RLPLRCDVPTPSVRAPVSLTEGLAVPREFFCTDTAPTSFYTLSLHDALPIFFSCCAVSCFSSPSPFRQRLMKAWRSSPLSCLPLDRKSTRLNSSHSQISYAVFCLKKKRSSQQARRLGTARPFQRLFQRPASHF